MLVFSYGCRDNVDTVVVDFTKTVAVTQPGDEETVRQPVFRVAVGAMISPKETFVYYRQLLDYVGRHLGRDIEFIQRKTYGEVNELFGNDKIDLAFICSGPYAIGKEKYGFELLAAPEVQGSHFYQSYLIVNKDSSFHRFEDLRGRVFAFTDPDSNTGRLVPIYWLMQMKEQPENFFSKTVYTYGHDNSILAVDRALVDGACVDGLIWEYYAHKNPVFTSRTRIIKKSEPYGIPPLVASGSLPSDIKQHIRHLLFSMHQDPGGQRILKELMIDKFIMPQEEWYESIRRMKNKVTMLRMKPYAPAKP
ncbi:MAG: phosphate/phosphite/phosphonate ABC transporter substrate-binding protein [Desulfobacterales bacterium]|nr:phosphate/phosphite/phosphonate ABC transporter substrate-binding protein [Desulfobacterales bacterium]